jgi:spermidine/putrescine transport system permease protein
LAGTAGLTRSGAEPAAKAAPERSFSPLGGRSATAILLGPGILWLVLFFLVPLGAIFVVSLGQRDALDRVSLAAPSLQNYVQAFDARFLPTFLNSLRYAFLTTLLCLLIGYPIAYWIAQHGGRRKGLLLLLVMVPFWTSYLIRTYAWQIVLRDNGVVNQVLQAVGLTTEPLILLNTDISVVLGMTYGFLPFAILPLYVSIERLDPSLIAAARDLYASGSGAFRHVTLPLTMPGLIAAAILTFIPAIGDFVTPDLLGGSGTTTIAKVVQELFLEGRDWPFGAALGFVLMLVTLAGALLALRTLRREVLAS